MRKRLAMLMASLFLVMGTVWAQIPTVSTAPANDQWDADTRWYTIQCNDGSKGYISLLHADGNGNLMLNNGGKPTGTQGLWCVVGDDSNGYQFYNYAGGTSKVLGATGSDGSGRMKLYAAGGNETDVTYKFDIKKLDGQDDYAFVRQKDSENQWWNNRDSYLSYWNSSNAYSTGCPGSQYIFAEVNIADFVANYKVSAIETLNSFASFATVGEAVSAIEAINVANLADLAAIDEKMEEVYEEIGYLAFRNSDVNQASPTRINAYLATRANREKGHGTNVTANWPNFVWSLKYAGGGTFYLYNAVHELYLGSPSSNGALSATPTAAYTFEVLTDGDVKKYEFKCGNQTLHLNNHTDGLLSNYDSDDPASRWYVETNLTERLAELKTASATLLNEAKTLAESTELGTFGRISDLDNAVTGAESLDLVVAGKAYFELGVLTPIAAQYKEAIIAFNLTPGKLYALRESTSGLYLDIQTMGIHEPGQTTNNISLNATPCAIYLEAGGGVSTWKMKSAAGKYAQQASDRNWNAVIGTTAYEWTFSNPTANLHAIARSDGKYLNIDTKAAGQPLYCDKDTGMEFEIIEFPMNKVDGIYALKSSTDTYLNFTTISGSAVSFQSAPSFLYMIPSANGCAFQRVEDEKQFIGSTHSWNATTDFSVWNVSEPVDDLVTITRVDDANKHLGSNVNTNTGTGIFTNAPSGCNQWILEKYYPLTIKYMLGGEELAELRIEAIVKSGDAYPVTYSGTDKTIASCTVNDQAIEAVDGTYAVTVNAATEVVVTLETNGSAAEETKLYALQSPTGTYFNFTAVTPTGGATTYASFQNTPSFLYRELSGESYYFEDFNNPGEYIGEGPSGTNWIVLKSNKTLWNISESDENGLVEISRSTDANKRLGHDGNTNAGTGIFTNVGSTCYRWKLIPAYPITIIYKNSNGEELETVKAAAMAGTGYSFTVDTKGGTLVSCVADKGTMTETDGTYSFDAVYGATTVTVTLQMPEVSFAPEADKAYVLKVKGQELYLNIRTLGVDDPNTDGSNNISLSARPFAAIYFEAGSTKGTWKMKNVNGKYVGASGWNPVICDAPHDWTIVLENGVVTIAKDAGAFVNANDGQVAAGNPLYCDKGTALQFELFDYDDVDFITGTGTRNGDNGVGGQGTIMVSEIHEEGLDKIPLGAGWRLTMEVENPDGVSYNKYGSSILAVGSEAFPEKNDYKGFQLYLQSSTNGGKLDAVFGGGDHYIDNVTYQGDFSLVVEYDGSSKITFTTVNAQGNEATNVLSGSLPEIEVFSYGLPTGINIKSAAIEVFDVEYTFHVGTTPEGEEIAVTYDGETFAVDKVFYGSELNLLLFEATEVPGYTWEVVADRAANTLTLNYTEVEAEDLQPVKDLVNRIGGEGTADKFVFVHTPWLNSKQETFKLGTEDGKIRIEGSTISAITTGLGWYLQNVAHINIAWNSLNEKTVSGEAYADLSNLPLPADEEMHTSDAKYRYYLNTCTFGYSMTSWTWKRWQQEIDWMALHGINMPLQLVGLEEVWRTFLIKCGYSETDAKAFVAGPAFIAWWAMNNLQGWGGTDPGTKSGGTWAGAGGVQDDAWYARQTKLAKQIVEAQRGLGMQPVLPGWSGMVPTNFASKSTGKYATRGNGVNWAGDFVRPLLLNTSIGADKYAEIAADYYECLEAVMGESQYYSMDPFHEGGGAGTMADYEYMYAAMEAAKPGSQWVIQQWQWSATQRYSLTAVPEGRLIVLDLFADGKPAFDSYNGYAPQDAVFCAIPNFGGRSGLMGRLQNVTDNYFSYKAKYASIKGIGAAPEAIEQTPVTYDLIFQLPWMNGVKPNVEEWVNNYAIARYGKDNAITKEAWSLLRQSVLAYGADGIEGPIEDVWAARPNLIAWYVSSWGSTLSQSQKGINVGNTYTPARRQMLIDAVYKLIGQKDALALEAGSIYESNYMYDLVEFGGGVMADYAHDLLLGINEAKTAAGANFATDPTYIARRDAFLQLILDMDAFKGTNLNFRLGKWTQEARDAAAEVTGATTATPNWYEYNNARTILSTWSSPGTNLTDYSYRSWQGLLKDYYLPRWEYFFNEIEAGRTPTGDNYKFFEWNWAHGKEHYVGQTAVSNTELTAGQAGHTDSYTREPEGNTVEQAVEMLRKYIIPIHMNDGTIYYAYRTFTYDLAGKVTVNVAADATVDFTHYFDIPGDATITGDFINNDEGSAPVNAVPVKPEEAVYTATITLADGTRLENFTVHTPSFNGVYKVSLVTDWGNTPVFIQYNENDNVSGYKMVAASDGYSTDSELDKWFSIAHSGDGYTISAQGKYLKEPLVWEYVLFSEDEAEAGTYLFDDSDTHDIYKIVNVDGYHLQAWSYVMALEPGNASPSTFVFEKVEGYPVTFPTDSFTTVYLPFNVLLPVGVEAYDVCGNELVNDEKDHGQGALEKIANSGDILKAGTPAVLKGAPGEHMLEIVMHSNKAKSGLPYSALRGSYEKHTLVHTDDIKKFVLHEKHFDDLQTYYEKVLEKGESDAVVEMPANTCWLEANIEANQIGLTEGSFVKIEDWLFLYEAATNGIKLTDAAVSGDGVLVIPSEVTINNEVKNVVAISPDFLHGNTTLTSITLPATLANLGFRTVEPMFGNDTTYYEGQSGDGGQYDGNAAVGEVVGAHREYVFPIDPTTKKPFMVESSFAWRLTLDVTIDNPEANFNNYGSAIVSTLENSLATTYKGYMQIYMKAGHEDIIVKIDNADDRYRYMLPELDAEGNEIKDEYVELKHFVFELEHDGTGGYQVVIYYDDGRAKMYNISASENNKVSDFDRLYYSLPEGIHVKVKVDKLISQGLFVGCTNLHEIIVDPANPVFKSCEPGVLYDKNGYYVMRIPEGETSHHFEIPSKVVKLYPGSFHGVKADIVLHSNPQIGVVEDHEDAVKETQFYLSLDDMDPDPTVNGARDFISTNKNTYVAANYKRAPLEEGEYGTIVLPFVPTKAMNKYDFFELTDADATSLHFSPVDELEVNTPYLYKLKENPGDMDAETIDGQVYDVFKTDESFTVQEHAKYDPNDEKPGMFRALGAYVNHYIETVNYPKSAYYYFNINSQKFIKVTKKLNYRPYRAIFVVTPESQEEAAQAPARLSLRITRNDGGTTEIDPAQVEGMEEPIYYDLQGRRVLNPTNGVYIVNGKKVIF